MANTVRCRYCSNEMPIESSFCKSCGKSQTEDIYTDLEDEPLRTSVRGYMPEVIDWSDLRTLVLYFALSVIFILVLIILGFKIFY